MLLEELKMLEATELEKVDQAKKHHDSITEKFQDFLQMSECTVDGSSDSSSLIQIAEDLHSQTEDLISEFESLRLCPKVNFLNIGFEGSDTDVIVGEISVHGRNTLEEIEAEDDLESHSSSFLLELMPPSISTDEASQPILPQDLGIHLITLNSDSDANDLSPCEPVPQTSSEFSPSGPRKSESKSADDGVNLLTGT